MNRRSFFGVLAAIVATPSLLARQAARPLVTTGRYFFNGVGYIRWVNYTAPYRHVSKEQFVAAVRKHYKDAKLTPPGDNFRYFQSWQPEELQ